MSLRRFDFSLILDDDDDYQDNDSDDSHLIVTRTSKPKLTLNYL